MQPKVPLLVSEMFDCTDWDREGLVQQCLLDFIGDAIIAMLSNFLHHSFIVFLNSSMRLVGLSLRRAIYFSVLRP